jgi:chorismate mutase
MDADTTVFGSVKVALGSSTSDVFVILLLRDKTWEAKIILIFVLSLTFDFRAFFDALIMSSKFSLQVVAVVPMPIQ